MLRVTRTENGLVKGLVGTNARITAFKGIPYAAPPVGELRWCPPQPAANWDGVRECFEFGPICYQKTPGKDPNAFYSKEWHVDPEVPNSEDGLYLNIWTSAKTGTEKMPVMIWIHGGGMQEGYSYEMEFDGEEFASRGVVLVSVGYRLNLFGFLATPELTAENPEAPTNFALLDQAAAIKWVKRNIANFGGDPDNITIFGQSGGGDAVQFQIVSPQTEGDFQRAIIQSAGSRMLKYPPQPYFLSTGDTMEDAYALSARLFEMCGVKTLAEARKLSAATLLEKYNEMHRPMVPVLDGKFVTILPHDAFPVNRFHDVSLMVTATSDEFCAAPTGDPRKWVDEHFPDRADDYWKLVEEAAGSDDEEALRKAASYSTFNVANRVTAEVMARAGRTVYFSEFGPTIPGDDAGAFHSCELWFEFNTLMRCWRPFDGHHFDLARKMCNYFANFAATGDPNGKDRDGTEMPKWLPYAPEDGKAMQFFDTVQMETVTDPRMALMLDENRKYWEEFASRQKESE